MLATVLVVLTLQSTMMGEAFVPTGKGLSKRSFTTTVTKPSLAFIDPAGTKSQSQSAATPSSSSSSSFSSSSLGMGIVEEFITSSDAKTRQSNNEAYINELQKRVDKINELEAEIEELSDEELQAKTQEFKTRLSTGKKEDINGPILEEMFAVVREAAW